MDNCENLFFHIKFILVLLDPLADPEAHVRWGHQQSKKRREGGGVEGGWHSNAPGPSP